MTDHGVPLRANEIQAALRGAKIGGEIHVLETTTSTNDAILERASADAISGLTIFAETQTAGRGQRGHAWESAKRKGLWLSVLLRPQIALADSSQLTTWAADGICETLAGQFGIDADIKPPNDVLIADKKAAGVLVEMRAQTHAPHLAILGIGLNVNQAIEDFSEAIRLHATSLAMTLGRAVNRTELAIALLRRLNATYRW